MSKETAITVTCGARLSQCECGLDPHPADVPHECVDCDPICGGSWLDDPDDSTMFFLVRWPGLRGNERAMAMAAEDGLEDPPPGGPYPREERPLPHGYFPAPRGQISFLRIPDPLGILGPPVRNGLNEVT